MLAKLATQVIKNAVAAAQQSTEASRELVNRSGFVSAVIALSTFWASAQTVPNFTGRVAVAAKQQKLASRAAGY